ncbi:signal peptide peptidase SppA [Candidatus Roizmanbacteria bacterium]|nr:signal peptide peptidase SppA [Candidatus Roizmanbacteria bacterium]
MTAQEISPTQEAPVTPASTPEMSKQREGHMARGIRFLKNLSTIVLTLSKLIVSVFFLLLLVSFFGGGNSSDSPGSTVLFGEGPEKIAVVDLSGTIVDSAATDPFATLSDPQLITPRKLLKQFEKIKEDDHIKAIVLRINSPGGSVTASDEIYYLIKRFREQTGIPVIASYGEVAASGGYYISLAADTIIADPTSITGSIGVIASLINVKSLADQYGIRELTVTAGNNKNFMSPLQEPVASQTAIIQTIVDEAYDQFIARINESRTVPHSTLTALADGRPLTGKQAHEAKLADQLGNFYDAVEYARKQTGFTDAAVVEFAAGGFLESLLGVVIKPFSRLNPFASITTPLSLLQGKPAYLYSP